MRSRAQTQMNKAAARAPSFTPVRAGLLQRKCACGGSSGSIGACAECRKEKLHRRAADHAEPSAVPPIVNDVLRSPGQSLDEATRAFMEPRLGHDFSQVRVHTGAKAAESARAVNALAYTVGQNIVFDSGYYSPGTTQGQQILAHELWHTIQQGGTFAPSVSALQITPQNDAVELEADRMAAIAMGGAGSLAPAPSPSTRVSPATLSRQRGDSFAKCEAMGVFCPPIKSFGGKMCVFNGCYRAATANLPLAVSPGACFYRCTDGTTCVCVLVGKGAAAECAINKCSKGRMDSQESLAQETLAMLSDQRGEQSEESEAMAPDQRSEQNEESESDVSER